MSERERERENTDQRTCCWASRRSRVSAAAVPGPAGTPGTRTPSALDGPPYTHIYQTLLSEETRYIAVGTVRMFIEPIAKH